MTKKNRNDYIKNPVSGRPIIVGGRTYNELVKQGYFEDIYKDENILDETENIAARPAPKAVKKPPGVVYRKGRRPFVMERA